MNNINNYNHQELLTLCTKACKGDEQLGQKVSDTVFDTHTSLEFLLGQVTLERLYQIENPSSFQDGNRFVSFCPVGTKEGSGKVRLTSEFLKRNGKVIRNQNRTEILDIIQDLASFEVKFKKAGIQHKRINLGLMPGWMSSKKDRYLFCIDLDNKGYLQGNIQKVIESFGIKCPIVSTPSGGKHLLVASSVPVGNSPVAKFVDIRGKTYWLAPGSITEKGAYVLDINNPMFCETVPVLPLDWKDSFKSVIQELFPTEPTAPPSYGIEDSADKKSDCSHPKPSKVIRSKFVEEGTRNDYLFRIASSLVGSKAGSKDAMLSMLRIERDYASIDPVEFNDKVLGSMIQRMMDKDSSKGLTPNSSSYGIEDSPSYSPRNSLDLLAQSRTSKHIDTSLFHTSRLVSFLKNLQPSSYGIDGTPPSYTEMSSIAPVVQRYFEVSFGTKYQKAILTKAVGTILREAGFTNQQRRIDGKKARFWNVTKEMLVSLDLWINELETNKQVPQLPAAYNRQETPTKPIVLTCLRSQGQASIGGSTEPSRNSKLPTPSELIQTPCRGYSEFLDPSKVVIQSRPNVRTVGDGSNPYPNTDPLLEQWNNRARQRARHLT